ncbi:acyl carrier protein [Coprinopsis marcescibilis]|uniref:Acyl carrier protein n=1 Tax=Coprinopsis marcescibilis TaxID=230819 RepID=A0A5C3LBU6_COPMA|nr:acyl carrier protein [Coprinopsis marcescibilis]
MSFLRLATRSTLLSRVAWNPRAVPNKHYIPRATYASGAGLSRDAIQTRIFDVLKGYEKVDPSKLTPQASFSKDLGLDSLDAVEVVMAVEEEFSIEIPDAEADQIQSVDQAIDYIAKTPEAH